MVDGWHLSEQGTLRLWTIARRELKIIEPYVSLERLNYLEQILDITTNPYHIDFGETSH